MEKIRIGEIKIHSIMLLFPDAEISYDSGSEQSLRETVENLKCDPNVRDMVLFCTPAINRAFSVIEKRGASKTKSATARVLNHRGRGLYIKLSEIASDVFNVVRAFSPSGKEVPFERYTDDEIYLDSLETGEYTFIYKSKIKRINEATSDFEEVDLSEGIAEIIPYFVKSEAIFTEDRGASDAARVLFDGILAELSTAPTDSMPEVKSVYLME